MRYNLRYAALLLLVATLVGCDGDGVTGPIPSSDVRPSTQLVPAGPTPTLAGDVIKVGDDDCPDQVVLTLGSNRDDDSDGLTNANEQHFGLLSNDSDSDDDGVSDGNDDSNGNGMDDEDEDDDCLDDIDSDGDGVDDEDEDDDDLGGMI